MIIKINWEGSIFVHHSLAMVNRELLLLLTNNTQLDCRIIPFEPNQYIPETSGEISLQVILDKSPHENADVYIRHFYPPNFNRPQCKKFIMILPWEFGSLPIQWVQGIEQNVDEIWVPSSFVKECFIHSGVPNTKVVVVPNGVNPSIFNPDASPLPWVKNVIGDRFCFLFNGGVIQRKGIDILVNAYLNEFTNKDNVCMLIKDSSSYKRDLSKKIQELASRSDIAQVIYSDKSIDPSQLGGLYTACNCYVHPYRAEGFGLPILEALACGLPTIVPGGGACRDFTNENTVFYIKCETEILHNKMVGDLFTVGFPFWLKPDMVHLQFLMRQLFVNTKNERIKAISQSENIRKSFNWSKAAESAEKNILKLLK